MNPTFRNKTSPVYTKEQQAVTERTPPLPPHAGEVRYQAALDADNRYRGLLAAALAVAIGAGSGFGLLGRTVGALPVTLQMVASAGFAWRLLSRRAFTTNRASSDSVSRPLDRLPVLLIVAYVGIASFRSGISALPLFGGALAAGTLFLLSAWNRWIGIFCCAAVGTVLGAWIAQGTADFTQNFHMLTVVSCLVAGLAVAIACLLATRSQDGEMRPATALPSLALTAWAAVALVSAEDLPTRLVCALLACIGAICLDRWIEARASFAPGVALTALFHLFASAYADGSLYIPIASQFAAVFLEFVLLGAAGYRHTLAALLRLPISTYRRSPQCIVPRLDSAFDHEVTINAI